MLTNLARLALLAMLFLTVLDIGGRYLFDHPLEGTTAIITQLLFPALVFLSLAPVAERDGHVRVELIWTKLKGSFGDVVVIVFSLEIGRASCRVRVCQSV